MKNKLLNYFKRKRELKAEQVALDGKWRDVKNDICTSNKDDHWKCPSCNIELTVDFSKSESCSGRSLASWIICNDCGYSIHSDGDGEIPEWWLNYKRKQEYDERVKNAPPVDYEKIDKLLKKLQI
jgi:hypothetical protein